MQMDIHTIRTTIANCYLLKAGDRFLLIDTCISFRRRFIDRELERHGCRPGDLKLIVITHGDMDHVGNAAYLSAKFNAPIGMHPEDAGMAEHGDMFWNRKSDVSALRNLVKQLFRLGKSNRFTPDVSLMDGMELSEFGFDLKIVGIPGHSSGSIGVLTPEGDLFCGDMYMNSRSGPKFGFGDPADFLSSDQKLKALSIHTIYPGHGDPFPMEALR